MQPNQQSQYDFIMNPNQNMRSGGPSLGGSMKRMILGIVFGLIVLMLTIIVGSVIFTGGGADNDVLINLRAHQTEIERVVELGQKNIKDPHLKQQMATLQATITSDQEQLAGLLSKRSVKVTKLALNTKKDSDTDSALEKAVESGNHDEALNKSIAGLLDKYYSDLSNAKAKSSSKTEKAILTASIENLEVIYSSN